jgi:hypothetical protein
MTNFKNIVIAVAAVAIIILTGYFLIAVGRTSSPNAATESTVSLPVVTATSTHIAQISGSGELKTYRNAEYGFEFQYPRDWIIMEEPHGLGFYSRFELVAAPNVGESNNNPFLVNIVVPEFAERTFLGVETTSTVTVAGISGIKYEYEFEGTPEVAIVLPLGQLRIILGTTKPYEVFFNQILASFKFL